MSNIYLAKGTTLREQYEDVGRLLKSYIQKAVGREPIKTMIAERVLRRVRTMPELAKFYACFQGWVAGAGITELAGMYLLADNTSGCQTAIVRYGSGVALLHTEEDYYDVQARMKGVHTIEFNDDGRRLFCLIYNDLMPGAGLYGWQREMIVAVDSLFLREDGITEVERPMLANIIAWLMWSGDARESVESLVARLSALGTVVDGYAVNVAVRAGQRCEGYKLTFARDDWEIEKLGSKPGDNLRQVNIVEPQYARTKKRVAVWRHAPWKMYLDYRGFLQRLKLMKEHIHAARATWERTLDGVTITQVHTQIQGAIFGKYRKHYVSEWMGAACVGILDRQGLSVSTKLHKDEPLEKLEYVLELT